jgi:hypothetical protein
MNLRITAAAVAVLALALSGCAGGDDDPKPTPTSSSATASPSVDQAAAEAACKEAWRKAIKDGSVDDGSVSGDNHPAACEDVKRSAKMGADALREAREAGRELLEACAEDPSNPACEGVPVP